MQVFKVYFKILKQIYPVLLVYSFIFFGISLLASTSNTNSTNINFEVSKPEIAFINYDEKTPLIDSFEKFLDANSTIVDIKDDDEKLSDALFYRQVSYIIKVPKGFSDSFMEGEDIKLDILKVPDAISSIQVESLINKFFNNARLYVLGGVDEQTLSENINNDLADGVSVEIKTTEKKNTNLTNANYYFNFTNYIFLALVIMVVGLIMQSFNKLDIKRRNLCSPVKISSINFQLILGNFSITFLIWLLFMIGSIILYSDVMFTTNGLLLMLNSFIFIITVLSIGFLIGVLIKNTEAQSAIANVVSLGSSFICGAFVPQMLLGEGVLTFARFIPSYWFIRANDIIGTVTHFEQKHMNVIITCMLIQVAFAALIYISTLIISRYKRQEVL